MFIIFLMFESFCIVTVFILCYEIVRSLLKGKIYEYNKEEPKK
jgi:hypothetical protein